MDLILKETDDYIKQSIDYSLGLPASTRTLQLKLQNSEEDRHRLQDVIFLLEERVRDSLKQLDQYMAEASMNAQGLRRCIEEKEAMADEYGNVWVHCSKLENECTLYEREFEKAIESLDELAKENEELRARQQDDSSISALAVEVDSLKKDKENMRTNLLRAEEEVKVLFEENRLLDAKNKRLVKQVSEERCQQSEGKTASKKFSTKGKRKSSLGENSPNLQTIDFDASSSPRQPLSPLRQTTPGSIRTQKKLFGTRTDQEWLHS